VATTAFVSTAVAAAFPSGGIIIWSGSVASIPSGWYLCNGSNGTPDLRDRFVVGAGSTYAVADTGGSANAIVVSHSHTATSTVTDPGHTHLIPNTRAGSPNGGTTASAGSSGTNANLPPYYALAYIMKA